MNEFKFDMDQRVRLSDSNEAGKVVGRAQYATSENQYLIRYQRTSGELTECWWSESAIEAA